MPRSSEPAQTGAADEPRKLPDQEQIAEQATPEATEQGPEAIDIAALKDELAESKKQSEYHLDQWKRSAASLQNYRKHVEKERADLAKSAKANVIMQLLPVLDDLERAFVTMPFELSSFTWTEGLAFIDRKLQLTLEKQGLEEIRALGEPFDPRLHQALLEEETEQYADGHVMAVLQKGYKLDDRILRPALVKIARHKAAPEEHGGAQTEQPADERSTGKGAQSTTEHSSEGN
jgi:molecular chaperone GrpE